MCKSVLCNVLSEFSIWILQTLLSSLHQDFVIVNPISLDVFGDKVYFSDNSTKEIWAVDSVSGKSRQFLNGRPEPLLKVALASELIALHVSHPLIQPTNYGKNVLAKF